MLVHEAGHWRLFSSHFCNDVLGQLWGGSPIFFSLPSFRWIHLKHHRDPLAPDDPDLTLTGGYPILPESMKRKLFRDITFRTQYKFIRAFNIGPYPEQILVWVSFGVAQAILILAFWYFGSALDYLWLWIVPQFTFFPVMLRLRGLVEHAGYARDSDQGKNSRTVVAPVGNLILAPNAILLTYLPAPPLQGGELGAAFFFSHSAGVSVCNASAWTCSANSWATIA